MSMFARPRKILHTGNLLNNAYLHCKYLRKRGIEADCLSAAHPWIQGQPEWSECHFTDAVEHLNPNWSEIDRNGFERPSWYFEAAEREIPNVADKIALEIGWSACLVRQSYKLDVLRQELFEDIIKFSGGLDFYHILKRLGFVDLAARFAKYGNLVSHSSSRTAELQPLFDSAFPERENTLSHEDILSWISRTLMQEQLNRMYSVVQGYSLEPILSLLARPKRPYVCYENGTMRAFPFEETGQGRLLALSYKQADKVIITNPDCIDAARRLGLDNTVFIPHLIDDDKFRPFETALRTQLENETGCNFIVVAPARHHWNTFSEGLKGTMNKGNDILIRGLASAFAAYPEIKPLVFFFEWGQEVEQSKELIEECGLTDRVRWEPMRSKPVIKDLIQAADLVVDQFNAHHGSFGATALEAMACEKPVMLNFVAENHRWCFPEMPPFLNASDPESVKGHLLELMRDKELGRKIGRKSLEWYRAYNSSELVIDRHVDIYKEIWDKNGWTWPY